MGGPPLEASIFLTHFFGGRGREMVLAVVNSAVFLLYCQQLGRRDRRAEWRELVVARLTAADPVVAPDRR